MTSGNAADGLSLRIAEHLSAVRFKDLSPRAVEMTKLALLDAVGVSLAASGLSAEVSPFVDMVRRMGGQPEATVFGFGLKRPAALAAFANGSMAHALDFEDSFDRNPCHPNASLVPAVLALSERHGGVDGKALVTAMAAGCDLVCRMGLSFGRPMEEGGWYPPPILGAFGAVAAAARLLGLTPRQICDAFSLLLCQATCSGEIKYSPHAVIRAVREAFPAQAAVLCVDLARGGVSGFEAPFEGEAGFFRLYVDGCYTPAALRDDLGARFLGEELSFKPWPSCRGTHAFVEACLAVRREHHLDWREIAHIRLTGGDVHAMLSEPRPQKIAPRTVIDAKFSLPFTVATTLKDGELTLGSFSAAALADEGILALASKVTLTVALDWPRTAAAAGIVDIELRDGRHLRCRVDYALGHPANPMARGQIIEKFRDCAGRARRPMAARQAGALAERILAIEAEPDIGRMISDGLGNSCPQEE